MRLLGVSPVLLARMVTGLSGTQLSFSIIHATIPIMSRGPAQFRIVTEFPPRSCDTSHAFTRALAGLVLPQVSAALYECTATWSIARRRQRHDLALLPLAGRARVGVDGRWYALSPRRLLLAPRGSWVQAEADPASPPRLIVLVLHADAAGGVPLQVAAGLPWAVPLRDEDRVDQLLLEACREDAQRVPGWQPVLAALVTHALVAVARRAGARTAIRRPAAAGALARISPALAVMGQDLAQPVRIPELALACGLGAVQFRRLFRAALDRSPVAHLQRLRLAEAQRLIAGGLMVREAAEAVGYRSSACLDRVFRKLAGTTPGRWRAEALR